MDRQIHTRYMNFSDQSVKNYTSDCIEEWDSETCGWCFQCYKNSSNTDYGRCTSCRAAKKRRETTVCNDYTFTNSTHLSWVTAYADCTICTTTYSDSAATNVSLNCYPRFNYTYQTYRTAINKRTRQNSSAVDWTERIFETDCDSYYGRVGVCRWKTSCIFTYTDKGIECDVEQMTSDTYGPERQDVFSDYDSKTQRYISATCTQRNNSYGYYSDFSCEPSSNYSYYSYNRSVAVETSFSESSRDSKVYRFYSDCNGSNLDNQCNWILTCTSEYSWFGYRCKFGNN